MTPVIHCSIGSAILFTKTTFSQRKRNQSTRCGISEKYPKLKSSRRLLLPQSSLRLLRLYGSHYSSGLQTGAAVGADLTVEEPNSAVSGETADENSEIPSGHVESSTFASGNTAATAPPKSKRTRSVRRTEMPPVKDEELVPGAWFMGKVRSIQPFGCFIDFGAFTDGLVHVSRISDTYVKDVASFVSVGQEVKVRIVEANKETGRISLTMRENDDNSKAPPKTESPRGESSEKPWSARKGVSRSNQKQEDTQRSSKFVKGQVLDGTVKNVTRSGAFVSLPDGEEGFLPLAEESEGFGGILGSSSLEVGKEVNVRVLRVSRGKVTLTMKKKEDVEGLNRKLNKGVVHVATNPFELAFRQNKEIGAFLDERDRTGNSSEKLQQAAEKIDETLPDNSNVLEVSTKTTDVEGQLNTFSDPGTELRDEKSTSEKLQEEAPIEGSSSQDAKQKDDESPNELLQTAHLLVADDQVSSKTLDDLSSDSVVEEVPKEETEDTIAFQDSLEDVAALKEEEISIPSNGPSSKTFSVPPNNTLEEVTALEDGDISMTSDKFSKDDESKTIDEVSSDSVVAEASVMDETKYSVAASGNTEDVLAPKEGILNESSSESITTDVSATNDVVIAGVAKDTVKDVLVPKENNPVEDVSASKNLLSPEDEKISETLGDFRGVQVTEGASSTEISTVEAPVDGATAETILLDSASSKPLDLEEVESPVDSANGQNQPGGDIAAQIGLSQSEDATANINNGKESAVGTDTSDNLEKAKVDAAGSSNVVAGQGSTIRSTISPALVKQLRDESGAGMMDCKKALAETGGDIEKAQEYLRKKGLASADKKASRATAEGRIGSYIHDNRIGVLIEVNCETDFVSRGEIFKELVDDLAMQVAACPQVSYLVTEDVPQEIVEKDREIEMQKEDLLSKPENIRSKIVDGRIKKRLEELALLEQPYIKNDKIVIRDWIKQTIATIGENIKVRRFVRYNLGEGLEKKSQDFAAEVAAQTAAKPSTTAPQQQAAESKEVVQKPSTVTVSAALVKQLREETGAGMMDCKKALSETGGDLEKAQEFLRKKGLSSADKKSSRLAAEGRIASYIHDSRIGALVEVNCETDFVGRNENFKELVEDLAMQVVACPHVEFVSMEDIPESIIKKEKEIEMGRDDLKSKPEQIKEKIVEGRITKRLGELALLEQPFIKDDSIKVKDLVKQTVASLGENIKVRRFVRFTLGESKD